MMSCFLPGCKEEVQYTCKCKNPDIKMCLTHMGAHYAAKCGMSPIHIDIPVENPMVRVLTYLSEVKKSVLVTYSNILIVLKNEMKKIVLAIQNEENKIKGFLSGKGTLTSAERSAFESKKLYNVRLAFEGLLANCRDTVVEFNEDISKHLSLSYRPEKDYRVNWGISKFTEMNKIGSDLNCAKCNALKTHQEMVPNEPGTFCLICFGGTQDYDAFVSPPQWGPPQDFGEKKKKHGHGHGHGHGHHDHHWKKKHHKGPPPQMTFCPPHVRPRCPYF